MTHKIEMTSRKMPCWHYNNETIEQYVKRLQDYAQSGDEEIKSAHAYALNLCEAMSKKVPNLSPDWGPLKTLIGLLTQIDNMAAGAQIALARAEERVKELESR